MFSVVFQRCAHACFRSLPKVRPCKLSTAFTSWASTKQGQQRINRAGVIFMRAASGAPCSARNTTKSVLWIRLLLSAACRANRDAPYADCAVPCAHSVLRSQPFSWATACTRCARSWQPASAPSVPPGSSSSSGSRSRGRGVLRTKARTTRGVLLPQGHPRRACGIACAGRRRMWALARVMPSKGTVGAVGWVSIGLLQLLFHTCTAGSTVCEWAWGCRSLHDACVAGAAVCVQAWGRCRVFWSFQTPALLVRLKGGWTRPHHLAWFVKEWGALWRLQMRISLFFVILICVCMFTLVCLKGWRA